MKYKSQVVQQHDQTIWQMLEESQSCFDAAPIGLAVLDVEGRFLRINRKLAGINGRSVAAHMGRSVREILSPHSAAVVKKLIRKIVKTGEPVLDVELATGEKVKQPGATRYWMEQWVPVKDSSGSVIAINVVVEEITARKEAEEALQRLNKELDRKVTERTAKLTTVVAALRREVAERRQAEEKLRQSQDQFRLLGASAPIGIYLADANGIVFCNDQFEKLCGLHGRAVLGRGYLKSIHPDDVGHVRSVRTGLENNLDIEHRLLVKGVVTWVRVCGRPVFDNTGKVATRIGTVEDITPQKELEFLLRLQRDLAIALTRPGSYEETLGRILDAACRIEGIDGGGIYVIDPDTGGANLVSHCGLSDRFVKKVMCYASGSRQVRTIMTGVSTYVDRPRILRASHIRKEGLRSLAVMPVSYDGGIVAVLNLASRTLNTIPVMARSAVEAIAAQIGPTIARLRIRMALQSSERNLRALVSELALAEENERRRIAYGLHDDISQMLATAKIKLEETAANLTQKEAPENLLKVDDYLAQVLQQSRSLTFDLASPVLHRFGLEAALVDLCHKMEARHNLSFVVRNDHQPKPISKTTEIMIFHAVRELIRNSVKHAKAKRVIVTLRRVGMNLVVSVQDNGIGFDPATSIALTPAGGFGLYAMRERMTYLGGSFAVKRISPRGVCITLSVPLSGGKGKVRVA